MWVIEFRFDYSIIFHSKDVSRCFCLTIQHYVLNIVIPWCFRVWEKTTIYKTRETKSFNV